MLFLNNGDEPAARTGAAEPGHHGASRYSGRLGNLTVIKAFDLAQHQGFRNGNVGSAALPRAGIRPPVWAISVDSGVSAFGSAWLGKGDSRLLPDPQP